MSSSSITLWWLHCKQYTHPKLRLYPTFSSSGRGERETLGLKIAWHSVAVYRWGETGLDISESCVADPAQRIIHLLEGNKRRRDRSTKVVTADVIRGKTNESCGEVSRGNTGGIPLGLAGKFFSFVCCTGRLNPHSAMPSGSDR